MTPFMSITGVLWDFEKITLKRKGASLNPE
jgi:hypothetical protein